MAGDREVYHLMKDVRDACSGMNVMMAAHAGRLESIQSRVIDYFDTVETDGAQQPAGLGVAILTPFLMLLPNPRRKGFLLFVDGAITDSLVLKLGRSMPQSASDGSTVLLGGSQFTSGPAGQTVPRWPGSVYGQWRVNAGTAKVLMTEFF